MAALFLSEIAIGLIHRAMPQVNVMMHTMPAKAWLTVAALALSMPILARGMGVVFAQMGATLSGVLQAAGR